eukprot:2787829-Prymnesium_polylepis.1
MGARNGSSFPAAARCGFRAISCSCWYHFSSSDRTWLTGWAVLVVATWGLSHVVFHCTKPLPYIESRPPYPPWDLGTAVTPLGYCR